MPLYKPPTDADIQFSDIATNDASTSKHGFLKKLDGNSAHFLDGTGAWAASSGSNPDDASLIIAMEIFA